MCVDFAGINGLQYVSVCIYNIYYTHHHAPMQSYFTHTYIYTHDIHIHYMSYIKKKTIYCANEKEEREMLYV